MEAFIDHYTVLGLPSGEEGFKLSEKEITKAYRSKALESHPDKRPDDPNAVIQFQKLQASYEILKDENSRRAFNVDLMIRMPKEKYSDPEERNIRKMMDELEERNRSRLMRSLMKQRKRKRMSFDHDLTKRTASFAKLMKHIVRENKF